MNLKKIRNKTLILIEKIPFFRPQELKGVDQFFFIWREIDQTKGLFIENFLDEIHFYIINTMTENRDVFRLMLEHKRKTLKELVVDMSLSYIMRQIRDSNDIFIARSLTNRGDGWVNAFHLIVDHAVQEKIIFNIVPERIILTLPHGHIISSSDGASEKEFLQELIQRVRR